MVGRGGRNAPAAAPTPSEAIRREWDEIHRKHHKGCGCWQCIGLLQAWVVESRLAERPAEQGDGSDDSKGGSDVTKNEVNHSDASKS